MDARNPNLNRYMARVTGSRACSVYSGASRYGGGARDSATEMRRSWRLSCVRDDVRADPKKSSTGFVVFWKDEVRSRWVTAAEGAGTRTLQSMGVGKMDIVDADS
jgi:hypothetical protein